MGKLSPDALVSQTVTPSIDAKTFITSNADHTTEATLLQNFKIKAFSNL